MALCGEAHSMVGAGRLHPQLELSRPTANAVGRSVLVAAGLPRHFLVARLRRHRLLRPWRQMAG